ncbi:MAG TPA: patatin-like phospholipase family protein [Syntrophomonadaceae bacterium]|nr:patatin-like phospholipase family protein [Syntrophomonadaceae bacterium]
MEVKPKIGLVLGAGSARGLAHIGVLQVFEENNIPFDFIVGCSMGAMVGGIYACGTNLQILDKMIESMNHNLLYDVQVPRLGFIAGKKISAFLELMTKKKEFDDLIIPMSIIATDLIRGEKVIIEEGLLAEAIRASISIPGVFHPIKKDDMVLVDGAVIDRLPIDVAREKGADIIIAVDVTFGEGKKVVINNTLDVIMTSLDIMQKEQFDIISSSVDILIQPKVGGFSSRSFDCSRDLIDLGREAAEDKLEEILAKISGYPNL